LWNFPHFRHPTDNGYGNKISTGAAHQIVVCPLRSVINFPQRCLVLFDFLSKRHRNGLFFSDTPTSKSLESFIRKLSIKSLGKVSRGVPSINYGEGNWSGQDALDISINSRFLQRNKPNILRRTGLQQEWITAHQIKIAVVKYSESFSHFFPFMPI